MAQNGCGLLGCELQCKVQVDHWAVGCSMQLCPASQKQGLPAIHSGIRGLRGTESEHERAPTKDWPVVHVLPAHEGTPASKQTALRAYDTSRFGVMCWQKDEAGFQDPQVS